MPTILARSSEGCIGFIKPVFFTALGVVFSIFSPAVGVNVTNFATTGIRTDWGFQMARNGKR